jgi:putative addiction module antidote
MHEEVKSMVKVTVRKIGNSFGVILPARALQALQVSEGDELFLTEGPEGLRITPYDPDFEKTVKVAEGVMARYRNALRELAK